MNGGQRRVLLTTVFVEGKRYYDYRAANFPPRRLQYTLKRNISFGLRFIKQNVPEVEILEYPSWEEYLRVLKGGWDIVGFSFYMNETPEILRMVEAARKAGAKEIWGGNYGILTPEIQPGFDRVFLGYGERDVGRALGKEVKDVVHPPLVWLYGTSAGLNLNPMGELFTSRGCNIRCSFCQTPSFCSRSECLSIESVERVIACYRGMGVRTLTISDENFGMFRSHTEKVIELLRAHGMCWVAMMRTDNIPKDLDRWIECGFLGTQIGIETLDPETMEDIGKKLKVDEVLDTVRRLKEKGRIIDGYYVLGFDTDTKESIKRDMKTLAALHLDIYQICVLTPLPGTPAWDEIENKYGIFERDFHKFDTKHLVWNHPNITPKEMTGLLSYAFRTVYPRGDLVRHASSVFNSVLTSRGVLGGARSMMGGFMRANLRKQAAFNGYFDLPKDG